MNYKELEYDNNPRMQVFLSSEEPDLIVPSKPIEEIYKELLSEIENPQEFSYEILQNIAFAQLHLNNPNIVNNECFQSLVRSMRNIVTSTTKNFSITVRKDALFLIDKFMEQEDQNTIHFIRDLEMTDSFLTLFEETDDIELMENLLRFFWIIAGHCEECHLYFIENIKNHRQIFDKIEYYICNPCKKITKNCITFLKNFVKFEFKRKSKFARTIASFFMQTIINNHKNPPPLYFIKSIYGLCQIIENNDNEVWRSILQEELTNNISELLKTDHPQSIYALLCLVYYWYKKGEIIEGFDVGIILNFLSYKNEDIDEKYVYFIRCVSSQIIEIFTSRGIISPLIKNGLFDIFISIYPDSTYKLKTSIITVLLFIAKNAKIKYKIQMVEMGFINMLFESIDVLDDEETLCKKLQGLIYLIQACQMENGNICIDIIQQIPEFNIIHEVANSNEVELKSTVIARSMLEQYFCYE